VQSVYYPWSENIPVRTRSVVFNRWSGALPPAGDRWNKVVIDWDSKWSFAEIVILRSYWADGWEGVWITGRRSFTTSWDPREKLPGLPPSADDLYEKLCAAGGSHKGRWDLFCWKDDGFLFVESKGPGDSIKPAQIAWWKAARALGVPASAFEIVQWDFAQPHEDHLEASSPRLSLPTRSPGVQAPLSATSLRAGHGQKVRCPGSYTPVEQLHPNYQPGVPFTSTKAVCPSCFQRINLLKDGTRLRGH
jgi:hypothetical protein